MLVDHRDDLVDERRRAQQRLRWHLHQLDPTFAVPAKALDRPVQLDRVARWLGRQQQELQIRLARELVNRCRALTRAIAELDRELEQRTAEMKSLVITAILFTATAIIIWGVFLRPVPVQTGLGTITKKSVQLLTNPNNKFGIFGRRGRHV